MAFSAPYVLIAPIPWRNQMFWLVSCSSFPDSVVFKNGSQIPDLVPNALKKGRFRHFAHCQRNSLLSGDFRPTRLYQWLISIRLYMDGQDSSDFGKLRRLETCCFCSDNTRFPCANVGFNKFYGHVEIPHKRCKNILTRRPLLSDLSPAVGIYD